MALIEHSNLEEYQDPVNYDLEFDGEIDKYQFYLELARSNYRGSVRACLWYRLNNDTPVESRHNDDRCRYLFRDARICAVEGGRVDCYFYGR